MNSLLDEAFKIGASLDQITHAFLARIIMADPFTSNKPIQTIAPKVLVRPIYFTLQNIVRPFDVPVLSIVFHGCKSNSNLKSHIVCGQSTVHRIQAYLLASGIEKKLTMASLIRVRIIKISLES